jgi:hypothetical protein
MSESDIHPIKTLQAKSDIFQTFLARTDKLAEKLGSLEAVPAAAQISRAMLYAYRGRKRRITPKAWRKLAQAEIAAGLESPVTGKTPIGAMIDRAERLGVPPSTLFSPAERTRQIKHLEHSIAQNEEMLELIRENLRLDRARLAEIKVASKK